MPADRHYEATLPVAGQSESSASNAVATRSQRRCGAQYDGIQFVSETLPEGKVCAAKAERLMSSDISLFCF